MNFMGEGLRTVRCQFDGDGAWLVFQRNADASSNFHVGWDYYKNGFGATTGKSNSKCPVDPTGINPYVQVPYRFNLSFTADIIETWSGCCPGLC